MSQIIGLELCLLCECYIYVPLNLKYKTNSVRCIKSFALVFEWATIKKKLVAFFGTNFD